MMDILSRAMKLAGLQTELTEAEKERLLKPFADAGSIAEYAKSGFAAGISAELVAGRSAKQLAPNDLTTRAEAVSIIEKLLKQAGLI
ncbi:Endo-1,4-beta-xylanase A precursor [compost metagenome]